MIMTTNAYRMITSYEAHGTTPVHMRDNMISCVYCIWIATVEQHDPKALEERDNLYFSIWLHNAR